MLGDTWNVYDNFAGYIDREGNVSTFDTNFHVTQDIFKKFAPKNGHSFQLTNEVNILQGNKVVKPGQFSVTYTIFGSTLSTDGNISSSFSYPFRSSTGTITVLP